MSVNNSWATSTQGVSGPFVVTNDGTYLYVGGINNGIISRISLANPTTTYTASFISTGFPTGTLVGLCNDGTYLYAAVNAAGYVSKYNMSTGALVAANFASCTTTGVETIATDGTYLFMANANTILQVALSNPGTVLYTYPFNSYRIISSYGGYFYAYTMTSDYANSIIKINPTNQTFSTFMSGVSITAGYTGGMDIYGDFLYLGTLTGVDVIHMPTQTRITNWLSGYSANSLFAMNVIRSSLYICNLNTNSIIQAPIYQTYFYPFLGANISTSALQSTISTDTNIGTGYTIVSFNGASSQYFVSFLKPSIVTMLVVGGGGGGGGGSLTYGDGAGGGGAGQVTVVACTLAANTPYIITVGAGGAGTPTAASGSGTGNPTVATNSGGNTSLIGGSISITANGGGYGGSSGGNNYSGANGGSGGGSSGINSANNPFGTATFGTVSGTTTYTNYGNAGGKAKQGGGGGGGGGATSVGGAGGGPATGSNPGVSGTAGSGYTFTVNGNTYGVGGLGGQGYNTLNTGTGGSGANGASNTGNGGGGGYGGVANGIGVGGNGGSGVVIIQSITIPCFKINTRLLTLKGYRKVQDLKPGDMVKTFEHGFVPVFNIGQTKFQHTLTNGESSTSTQKIVNPQTALYVIPKESYPGMTDDLVMTGTHSILVKSLTESQRRETLRLLGDIYITENHYRLPICLDEHAEPYGTEGTYLVYHLALENDDYYMNYGVYANGLLVETCSKRYLVELSNMKLLDK